MNKTHIHQIASGSKGTETIGENETMKGFSSIYAGSGCFEIVKMNVAIAENN